MRRDEDGKCFEGYYISIVSLFFLSDAGNVFRSFPFFLLSPILNFQNTMEILGACLLDQKGPMYELHDLQGDDEYTFQHILNFPDKLSNDLTTRFHIIPRGTRRASHRIWHTLHPIDSG